MTENITDNMNEDGYEGIWYSYIEGMTCYRVQLHNNVYRVFTQDMVEIDDDDTKQILDKLNT